MEDFSDELYPEITLETEDILMTISVKKSYSDIEDINKRKEKLFRIYMIL